MVYRFHLWELEFDPVSFNSEFNVAPSEHVQRVQRPAMIGKVVGTGDAAGGCAHAGD